MNLHRQDNSSVLVAVHQAEDQDTSSEMKECRCRTVTGLHPLHTPHSNPDVHPTRVHICKVIIISQNNPWLYDMYSVETAEH